MFRRRLVRLLLVLAIFGVLLSHVDRGALIGYLRGLDAKFLVAMLAVNAILLWASSWRWFWIATAAGVRAPLSDFVRATWLSWAVSEFGPSLVFGEWARFWRLRMCADPLRLGTSQFVDRLSAYLGLVALAMVSVSWYFGSSEGGIDLRPAAALAAVGAVGGVMMTLLLRRFRRTLKRDIGSIGVLQNLLVRPTHYGLSLLTNLLFTANFVLSAMAVGCDASLWSLFCLAPLVLLGAGSLPSLVSDWGKREAAATIALTQIGLDPAQSLAISVVYGGMHLVSALPGLLIITGDHPAQPDAG